MFLGAWVGTCFRVMLLNASVVGLIVHIFRVSLSITRFWLGHGSSTGPEVETGPEMHNTLITDACPQQKASLQHLYSMDTIITITVLK